MGKSGIMRWLGCGALLLALATAAAAQGSRNWKPLTSDRAHDPASPAVKELQAPATALSKLPAASGGNLVDWSAALQKHLIAPRAGVDPKSGTDSNVVDMDIVLDPNGSLRPVRFSHQVHTQWLDCTNCHDALFKMEKGANRISMVRILEGKQCGVCHGAVAFPLTECKRCHNLPWDAGAEAAKPK